MPGLLQEQGTQMIRVLVTGVGSLLGQGILKSIQDSTLDCYITGTDYFPSAVGLYWVDKGYILPDILIPEISELHWIEVLINVIKQEEIEIVCPEDATVGDLREKLAEKYPVFAERMESIAVSVNQEFSGDGVRIAPGDEVAFIPPISGGCA